MTLQETVNPMKIIVQRIDSRRSFIGCFVIGILLTAGCGGKSDPNSRSATEYVLSAGGKVIQTGSDLPIDSSDKIPEHDFAIREIDLTDAKIKNIDLKKISNLPYLESLNLHGTNLNNKGLATITDLPKLRSLEIAYTRVTDEGVSKLTRFPQLKKIFLYGTAIKTQTIEDLESNLRGSVIYK